MKRCRLSVIGRVSATMLGVAPVVTAAGPVAVAVGIPPHAWLIEQIGGDHVSIEVMVAPGESPETYMPSDVQVTRLMRSQIYFRAGVPFESGPTFEAVRSSGRFRIVDLTEGIEIVAGDPHIWLSPRLLIPQARRVAAALAGIDPDRRGTFEEQLTLLEARLAELDRRIEERLRPFTGRSFYVFHPSWSYFARDYGLVQVAIEREGKEPSDHELTALLNQARRDRVTTVFLSPQIHSRAASAFAAGLGARVEQLDPLPTDLATGLAATADKLERAFREAAQHE